MKHSARTVAAQVLYAVLVQQKSLAEIANPQLDKLNDPRERRLAQELTYGVLRQFEHVDTLIHFLLKRSLKKKDGLVHALLLIGAYQILYLRIPEHAAVSSVVDASKKLGAGWARGLINGSLRNVIRQKQDLLDRADAIPSAKWRHPSWLIEKIQQDWPDDWQTILEAAQDSAPMNLRINVNQIAFDAYLDKICETDSEAAPAPHTQKGIRLSRPQNPRQLPGYEEGWFSVQDSAAQLAASLLDAQANDRVLDACAAPGGKTTHILESCPEISQLVAIDSVASRVDRIRESLDRLDLSDQPVNLIVADASDPQSWWDGTPFDRILLDAPCSATGVIRRHPDIKRHRRAEDLLKLTETQAQILDACWSMLATGGRLVYVTCSIFNAENCDQIVSFLSRHKDAQAHPIEANWGRAMQHGRQILPGEEGMDGFYYACLEKIA